MASTVMNIGTTVQAQSLNTIVTGFSFASALAWYEVVKDLVAKFAKGNGLQANFIAALVTTLLAVVVYMLIKNFVKNVEIKEPGQPMFAVTR